MEIENAPEDLTVITIGVISSSWKDWFVFRFEKGWIRFSVLNINWKSREEFLEYLEYKRDD